MTRAGRGGDTRIAGVADIAFDVGIVEIASGNIARSVGVSMVDASSEVIA
jgi:hypothetical protein